MPNSITGSLPGWLDQILMDLAQSRGGFDYNDIMALGRAWDSIPGAERAKIKDLAVRASKLEPDTDIPDDAYDRLVQKIKTEGKRAHV